MAHFKPQLVIVNNSSSTEQNPVFRFDLTIPVNEVNTVEHVKSVFEEQCKKWAFQKEQGENTGYIHYQCRVSLKAKQRLNQVIKTMQDQFGGCHISPTSGGAKDDDIYVMKPQSRIEGPWTDKDPKPLYIPLHLREVENTWYSWQKKVIELIEPKDAGRSVNLIYDPEGGKGKSTLCNWLGVKRKAIKIPNINDGKDVMRSVMDQPKLGTYFVDIPRAMEKSKLANLIAGIETVKDGYAYDDRYHFKCEYFDRPHVWIFANKIMDPNYYSADRWKIWIIDINNDLVSLPREQVLQIWQNQERSIVPNILGVRSLPTINFV